MIRPNMRAYFSSSSLSLFWFGHVARARHDMQGSTQVPESAEKCRMLYTTVITMYGYYDFGVSKT